MDMHVHSEPDSRVTQPWNKGKLTGAKPPLRPKHVWAVRTRLQLLRSFRDLALFNLAIDSKLRGCDVVGLRSLTWHPMVTLLIEPPLDNAKQGDRFVSRSRSKLARRLTTISRNEVNHPVHTSSLDAVRQAI